MKLTHFSLCTGIGGIDLAAEWAGFETVGQCEIEEYPRAVLWKIFGSMPRWRDVRDVTARSVRSAGIKRVDLLSAGYPCQPFSNAGKREGENDSRHLWPEVLRVIRELRPAWFLGENVAGHLSLGLDHVLDDLEGEGYTCRPVVLPACAGGAPQERYRVFILAHAESERWREAGERGFGKMGEEWIAVSGATSEPLGNTPVIGLQRERAEREQVPHSHAGKGLSLRPGGDGADGPIESGLGGVLDGLSDRMDGHRWPAGLGQPQHEWEPPRVGTGIRDRALRLKALGNAVVPQQVLPVLKAIYDTEKLRRTGGSL